MLFVFAPTSLRSIRTATIPGPYSPVWPSRSVSKRFYEYIFLIYIAYYDLPLDVKAWSWVAKRAIINCFRVVFHFLGNRHFSQKLFGRAESYHNTFKTFITRRVAMCRKSLLQTKGCLLFIMILGCMSLWIANKTLEQNFSKGTVHCT